jgi:hypothetical protein
VKKQCFRRIAVEQVTHLRDDTASEIQGLAQLDRFPFTQNFKALKEGKRQHLRKLGHEMMPPPVRRGSYLNTTQLKSESDSVINTLWNMGYNVKSIGDLLKLNYTDPWQYSRELNMMAEVHAYFDVRAPLEYKLFVNSFCEGPG